MSDDLYDGPCEAGCSHFHGGEVRHHPDCGHYPESLTKLNADRIEALETENARMREAMGPFVALAKDRAVDAAEWRGKDSIHAIMRVDDLRRILSASEKKEKDDG